MSIANELEKLKALFGQLNGKEELEMNIPLEHVKNVIEQAIIYQQNITQGMMGKKPFSNTATNAASASGIERLTSHSNHTTKEIEDKPNTPQAISTMSSLGSKTLATVATPHPLQEIYEMCNAGIEYTELSLKWVDEADYYQLKTHCQKRLTSLQSIPEDIHILKKTVKNILKLYIQKYTHIKDIIAAGANQDDVDDLYFFTKNIAFRKFNVSHSNSGNKKNLAATKKNQQAKSVAHKTNSKSDENLLKQILAKLKPLISKEAKEILDKEYLVDDPNGKSIFNYEEILKTLSEPLKKFPEAMMKYYTTLGPMGLITDTESRWLGIFQTTHMTTNFTFSDQVSAELNKIQKAIIEKPHSNGTLLFKNWINETKKRLEPIWKQTQYCNEKTSETIKFSKINKVSIELSKRYDSLGVKLSSISQNPLKYPYISVEDIMNFAKSLNACMRTRNAEIKKSTGDYHAFLDNQAKIDIPTIKSMQESLNATKTFHNEVETIVDEFSQFISMHEKWLNDTLSQAENRLQEANNIKEPVNSDENSNANIRNTPIHHNDASKSHAPSTIAIVSEPKTMSSKKKTNKLTIPPAKPPTAEEWAKTVASNRARKLEMVQAEKLKATEAILLEVQRRRDAQKKFTLAPLDLKKREEAIRHSIRQNPVILDAFQALYSLHPVLKQYNCFAHDDLESLVNALKTQKFNIRFEYRDSHYCLSIEEIYGYIDQEQLEKPVKVSENASGVKPHNKDYLYLSNRTLNGFRKMFMRAGFTPEVLGISQTLAPGTLSVRQDLTHMDDAKTTKGGSGGAPALAQPDTAASITTQAATATQAPLTAKPSDVKKKKHRKKRN